MSLLAVGGLLEGKHDYVIIDGNLEPDPLGTLDQTIRETDAQILALTVMPGPQLHHAVPLCRQIKATHPNTTIVWGGYFPTQHYEVCLKSDYVDYVLRGHSETAFKLFVDTYKTGNDLSGLAGLAFRHTPDVRDIQDASTLQPINVSASSDIISNPLPAIPHPDKLPDFPYHRIDMARYIRPTFMGRRTLPHHSSYGCPFFCNFCAVVNMVEGRWLAQSAERTANVVHHLVNTWEIDAVEFYDNNFLSEISI